MAAEFVCPVFASNAGGWGPTSVPAEFKDMPFAPYDKGTRLGKCADFAGVTTRSRAACAGARVVSARAHSARARSPPRSR